MKTHKATAKRFKYTGSGKLMRTKIGKSHLRRKKAKRVKRMYDEMHEVTNKGLKKRVRKLAPYLKNK
jgi:large subunit ribosomal protein L35